MNIPPQMMPMAMMAASRRSALPAPALPSDRYEVDQGAGLVVVRPYDHDFESNVKGRWIGRTVVEVFAQEFPYRSVNFYERQRRCGRLVVRRKGKVLEPQPEGEAIPAGQEAPDALRTGDTITHTIHRHEVAVAADAPLTITRFIPASDFGVLGVRSTDGLLCINKPASLPVHPCGRYHRNTASEWLKHGYFRVAADALNPEGGGLDTWIPALKRHLEHETPHTVHRLDKATSGVLLVATTRSVSAALHEMLKDKSDEELIRMRATLTPPAAPGLEEPARCAGEKAARPKFSDSGEGHSLPDSRPVKQYVARVHGKLSAPAVIDRGIFCKSRQRGVFAVLNEAEEEERRRRVTRTGCEGGAKDVQADVAMAKKAVMAGEMGVGAKRDAQRHATDHGNHGGVDEEGPDGARWARTEVRPRAYDPNSDTTLVECLPTTGRTHQLRVHLALLGHPIVLDAVYGPSQPSEQRRAAVGRWFGVPADAVTRVLPQPRHTSAAAADDGDEQDKPPCVECDDEEDWSDEFYDSFVCLHAERYTLPSARSASDGNSSAISLPTDLPRWAHP